MEITDSSQLGYIFSAVGIITLLLIIVFSRWPAVKDQDD